MRERERERELTRQGGHLTIRRVLPDLQLVRGRAQTGHHLAVVAVEANRRHLNITMGIQELTSGVIRDHVKGQRPTVGQLQLKPTRKSKNNPLTASLSPNQQDSTKCNYINVVIHIPINSISYQSISIPAPPHRSTSAACRRECPTA